MILEDGLLCCAGCGGTYLHHDRIEVFNRSKEDALTGVRVRVAGLRVATGPDAHKGNPSSRRDGVAIRFWCEQCPALTDLLVAQHKGQTEIYTVISDPLRALEDGGRLMRIAEKEKPLGRRGSKGRNLGEPNFEPV